MVQAQLSKQQAQADADRNALTTDLEMLRMEKQALHDQLSQSASQFDQLKNGVRKPLSLV